MRDDDRAPAPTRHDAEERAHRTFVNLAAAAFLLLLAIIFIWVFKSLDDQRKLQNCLNSGRRNCVEVEQRGSLNEPTRPLSPPLAGRGLG